jgi:hypothetical protein
LRLPIAWRFLGKQFLVIAERAANDLNSGPSGRAIDAEKLARLAYGER